jgi:hypothetical protein
VRCGRCTKTGYPRSDPRGIYLGRYCDTHYEERLSELNPEYLAFGPDYGEEDTGDEDESITRAHYDDFEVV